MLIVTILIVSLSIYATVYTVAFVYQAVCVLSSASKGVDIE